MTDIETYKEKKKIAERLERDVNLCLGRDGPDNVNAVFREIDEEANWCPMMLGIELSYGYKSSPKCYTVSWEHLGDYHGVYAAASRSCC